MHVSVGRFFTIALEKGDKESASEIFNTNHLMSLLLISLVFPAAIILVIFIPSIITVPTEYELQVRILLITIIIAFFLKTYSLNFELVTFAKNRFDLRNWVSLFAQLINIAIIVFFFWVKEINLIYVGIGAFSATLFTVISDYFLWQQLLPEIRLVWRNFKKKTARLLVNTGGWAFFYQASFILFLNVDMFIANKYLPLDLVGQYGALIAIPKNLRVMSTALGSIWQPLILARYSKNKFSSMDKLVQVSIKLSGGVLALIVGLIAGLSKPFLLLWLGSDFESMAFLLSLMVLPLASNLIVSPFFNWFYMVYF